MRKFSALLIIVAVAFVKPNILHAQIANVKDSLALVALYNSTDGAHWTFSYNWLTGPVSSWYGVYMDTTGRVQSVFLGGDSLRGVIPPEIGVLTSINELDLSSNRLTGSIPAEIGNLTNLGRLDLSVNSLSGSIPSTIGNLVNLTWLYLQVNNLSGSIPSTIGNLVNLNVLWMWQNQLSGSLPPEMGSMTNLQNLDLDNNQLSGSLPSEMGNLVNLKFMNLEVNRLTGSIPASLGNLVNLNDFTLEYNRLSGSIPSALGKLQASVDLSHNQLTGNIPTGFGSRQNVNINFSYNQLNGAIPVDLGDIEDPVQISLEGNFFTFDGMELIAEKYQKLFSNRVIYAPQNNIQIHFNATTKQLSVSAGGTLSNNTYTWYNNNVAVKTITGDSTFTPTIAGSYSVKVTNSVATQLTLYSDMLPVTSAELPITLLQFTAQAAHNDNLLQWQTATEINSAYFNIQRSESSTDFITIGEVAAAGNSSSIKNYKYTDMLAGLSTTPPVLYYRLQEVDKDGNKAYSKIIEINTLGGGATAMLLYPNPVHDKLTVLLKNISGKTTFALISTTGKVLQTQDATVVAGQSITLNTPTLTPGVYLIQIKNNQQTFAQKFVKY